jgi:hypothetical protein
MLIDGKLMSQGEDFQLHGMMRLEPGGEISQSG